MNEIIRMTDNKGLMEQNNTELAQAMRSMSETMMALAQMISATNERMAAMERKISALEKITPSQATELTRMINQRAKELCEVYRAVGCEKHVGNAIRRSVKLETGCSSFKGIARCDYHTVKEMILDWDDFGVIRAIRKKVRENT